MKRIEVGTWVRMHTVLTTFDTGLGAGRGAIGKVVHVGYDGRFLRVEIAGTGRVIEVHAVACSPVTNLREIVKLVNLNKAGI